MRAIADLATPVAFPSLEEPSTAERQALERLARACEQALAAALRPLCGVLVAVRARWELPGPAVGTEAQVIFTWRQGPLGWWLAVPRTAAEGLLGGLLGYGHIAPREALTPAEVALLQPPLAELPACLAGHLASPQTSGLEVCGAIAAEAPLLALHLALTVGESESSIALLAPWRALRGLLGVPGAEARLTLRALDRASVALCAEITGPTLTVRDLLDLQPGDVVRLGPADRLVTVSANGSPFARGKAGARGDRLAINLREVMPLREDADDSQ